MRDVSAASAQEKKNTNTQAAGPVAIPGGLPQDISSAIPDWYKIGWRAQSQALLDSGGDLQEARQRSLLAEFLDESYYGAWYHKSVIRTSAWWASHNAHYFVVPLLSFLPSLLPTLLPSLAVEKDGSL